MEQALSPFVPDGVDPLNREAAIHAAGDCVNAASQLLDITKLFRRGADTTRAAMLRCLFDLDRAIVYAGHYHGCGRLMGITPCVKAVEAARIVRQAWIKSVALWKSRQPEQVDGWCCLWDVYQERFGDTVGPTWADAVTTVERSDADDEGLINTFRIYIPERAVEHQWHFGAWPAVCEELAKLASTDKLIGELASTDESSFVHALITLEDEQTETSNSAARVSHSGKDTPARLDAEPEPANPTDDEQPDSGKLSNDKPGRKPTVNDRMKAEMASDLERVKGFTAKQWSTLLECGQSTVKETPTWKSLMLLRHQARAEKRQDRHRRGSKRV